MISNSGIWFVSQLQKMYPLDGAKISISLSDTSCIILLTLMCFLIRNPGVVMIYFSLSLIGSIRL
jgi:hypothetical protein